MSISANGFALGNRVALNSLSKLNQEIAVSTQKLSTGSRINHAADDAAGLTQRNYLISQIRGNEQAKSNLADGINVLQMAEAGVSQVHDGFQQIRELLVEAESGIKSVEELNHIQREINTNVGNIVSTMENTTFNGNKILQAYYLPTGGFLGEEITVQTGANDGDTADLEIASNLSDDKGLLFYGPFFLGGFQGNLETGLASSFQNLWVGGAESSYSGTNTGGGWIDDIDTVLKNTNRMMVEVGTRQNAFLDKIDQLDSLNNNLKASKSALSDLDIAKESSNYTKKTFSQQAATLILSQANTSPNVVLNLINSL